MKFPHRLFVTTVLAIAMLAFFGVPQAAFAKALPDESYYQMDVALQAHTETELRFSDLKGSPAIISMFYGTCPHVCPMLISSIQQVEGLLEPKAREGLQVLMVSVDPERDTPAALANIAAERKVDDSRWLLARTANPSDTRALAAMLDIKYKQLPDGQFNHTSVMILLDEQGREVTRSSKLGKPDLQFVAAVQETLTNCCK